MGKLTQKPRQPQSLAEFHADLKLLETEPWWVRARLLGHHRQDYAKIPPATVKGERQLEIPKSGKRGVL